MFRKFQNNKTKQNKKKKGNKRLPIWHSQISLPNKERIINFKSFFFLFKEFLVSHFIPNFRKNEKNFLF